MRLDLKALVGFVDFPARVFRDLSAPRVILAILELRVAPEELVRRATKDQKGSPEGRGRVGLKDRKAPKDRRVPRGLLVLLVLPRRVSSTCTSVLTRLLVR